MDHGLGLRIPARVTEVIDGDTIEIEVRRKMRIRLLDCWAPETRTTDQVEKQRGQAAAEYLTAEANGEIVVVEIPIEAGERFGEAMSFDRVLGRVFRQSDGQDLGELMVEAGHATREKHG